MTLKEAANVVVRYLDPFYTQGKFASKVRDEHVSKIQIPEASSIVFLFYLYFLGSVGPVQVLRSLFVPPYRGGGDCSKGSR